MMRRVLNFGAGTQSSALLAMMADGLIEPAEAAVFSDVGWEPQAVYDHLAWMQSLKLSIPIIVLKTGDIRADGLTWVARGTIAAGQRKASMPLYTKKVWQPDEAEAYRACYLSKPVEVEDAWSLFGSYTDEASVRHMREYADLRRGLPVVHKGMIRRQCTQEYKIEPIRRWIRENMLGLSAGQVGPREPVIELVFGISFDERSRTRISTERWGKFRYPFVEMKWTREKVIRWTDARFPGRKFPRSACLACPYHSNDEWRDLRDNRPEEWADVVAFDRAIRHCGGMRGDVFVHRDCVPLDEADISVSDAPWLDGMVNECHGMCGV